MRGRFVPDIVTPLCQQEAADAIRVAVERITGAPPSSQALAVLMAQTALETGRWQSLHRFNWGNIKAGAHWPHLYTCFRCNEVINGRVQWFQPDTDGWRVPPGHPQTRFRAYRSAQDGAEDHIRFLAVDTDGDGRNKYATAWGAAMAGEDALFVQSLKLAGYFTAPLAPYLRAVQLLTREFGAWLSGQRNPNRMDEREELAECANLCSRIAIPYLYLGGTWQDDALDARNRAIAEKDFG
jgi:hypothetical protein